MDICDNHKEAKVSAKSRGVRIMLEKVADSARKAVAIFNRSVK